MINISKNIFQLDTKNTSMVIKITAHKHAELLHYGGKVSASYSLSLVQDRSLLLVNSLYPDGDHTYGIDDMAFAYSSANRGDSRVEALRLTGDIGDAFDFQYDNFTTDELPQYNDLAHSNNHDNALKLQFKDACHGLVLDLWFLVYEGCDTITRFSRITNLGSKPIDINAIMSAQFDMPDYGYSLVTFDGAWGRERQRNIRKVDGGSYILSSRSGMSSPEHNPLFMLTADNCSLSLGDCYGFNLVYSGNHEIRVESDYMGRIRVQNGILRDGFCYTLAANESFVTPESVATFSDNGSNGASINLSQFTENHIIKCKVQPPIMLNSWEAMYFDISEEKIMDIARGAAAMGFEALVVDDGWFGARNDDTTSLGDWYPNRAKFPQGMQSVGKKLHSLGLKFGLWVEPEMISIDSELYRTHPEWAVYNKNVGHIVGRNQYLLDLSQIEVQRYLIEILTNLVIDNSIDYLKWDFNRRFAECGNFSQSGMFSYEYNQGLYAVLKALNINCPDLIIEGCASGGGRFDLGMLCFCPIIWVSDNTDTYSRMHIQEGTSYGYPISCQICHVSTAPNHQTQRTSTIDTRIAVASFGVMGAQMDVRKLVEDDRKALTLAIIEHKASRALGNKTTYRLHDGFISNEFAWLAIDKDKTSGKILIYRKRFNPLNNIHPIKLVGLNDNVVYSIANAGGKIIATATGETLKNFGFLLPQTYQGNEKPDGTIMLIDNTAVVYTIQIAK